MTSSDKKSIRVRMAPSPTGLLHFGTARTALFNWLFAKNQGGTFVLRIEDTDTERSKKEYENDIVEGFKWLGIDWDEGIGVEGEFGPYRQSERLETYEKYLKQLINEGKAYYCFCSKEELEKDKQAMASQGLPPKYSGKCRDLALDEALKRVEQGQNAVIRLKIPGGIVEFSDMIRGKISTDVGLIGDIVIAKGLNQPLYSFAVVVDDYEMQISHVIRGEDHISNTPKQIMIQKALGFEEPKYAHLPLILAPDRSKLSKRYMETSLMDFKAQGYLPEALINFMAFLGWHPVDDREIMPKEEIIKEFDIKRVQKAGAVFNLEKLEWINAQYIKAMSNEALVEALMDFVPENWKSKKDLILKIVKIEKERLKKLADFTETAGFYFDLPEYEKSLLVWKNMTEEEAKNNLNLLLGEIKKVSESDFNKVSLEAVVMPLTEVHGRGQLLWPLRASLSGKSASPGPMEIMEVVGRDETIRRVEIALGKF